MLKITRSDCLEGRGDIQLSALIGELHGLPFKWFIVGTRGAVELVTPVLGSARRRFRERMIQCYPLHKRRPHAVRSAGSEADEELSAAALDWVYNHAPDMLSSPERINGVHG